MPIPKIDMVLARSYENIDWWFGSHAYPLIDRTFIYNKGTDLNIPESPKNIVRILPNHGKESSTYIKHCILNYDDLGDYTIFTQANPHDHSQTFVSKIHTFATMQVNRCDLAFTADRHFNDGRSIPGLWNTIYNLLFDGKANSFTYSQGSHYIVSKRAIQFRTHNFYKRCLSLFFKEEGPFTQIPAYTFEGLWQIMWDMETPQQSDALPWDYLGNVIWGPSITTVPKASDITHGQPLEASILSGGAASVSGSFAFKTPDVIPDVGTKAHLIVFNPTNPKDKNIIKETVDATNVTVKPAT